MRHYSIYCHMPFPDPQICRQNYPAMTSSISVQGHAWFTILWSGWKLQCSSWTRGSPIRQNFFFSSFPREDEWCNISLTATFPTVSLFESLNTALVCWSRGAAQTFYPVMKRYIYNDTPAIYSAFSTASWRSSSTHVTLTLQSWSITAVTSAPELIHSQLRLIVPA